MSAIDYKAAYERQKVARVRAENLLEDRSRDLYDANKKLKTAFEKLKNQKAQLIHQEKLASIGQLSAGVAHEINNPTGFVKSNLSTLKRYQQQITAIVTAYQTALSEIFDLAPDSYSSQLDMVADAEEQCDIDYILKDLENLVDESIDGTQRIHAIVNGLKTFSRVDSEENEVLDVNACIENTLKLVQNEIKYQAELKMNLGELPLTMGYPGSLSQVVLNMLVNASQSMTEFGWVSIETYEREKQIFIVVTDNGCGIDEETLNKIFDPFFTTKDVGVGTGLGLSISLGIIKKHGGTVAAESEVGKGTCFTICLPVLSVEPK